MSRLAKVAISAGAVVVLLVLVVIVGAVTGVLRTFRAPSPSMEPTIHTGAHFLVGRMSFPFSGPHRGDVIVFHPPPGALGPVCAAPESPEDGHPCPKAGGGTAPLNFIERIVGMPGDELFVRNNRVYVNGRKLREPYVKAGTPCDLLCNLPKPITIPPGQYYVMGDNRGESADSRIWGPITRGSMIGRYLFAYT